jgi:transcriptional regulator with XRE-family HTH domain
VGTRLGDEVRRLRIAAKLTQQALADRVHYSRSYIALIETGREQPSVEAIDRVGRALQDNGALTALQREIMSPDHRDALDAPATADELDALELSRRVEASDLGSETLDRLQQAVDRLARDYPRVAPTRLLLQVRRHLGYVAQLIEVRKTLDQQRTLLVTGGWLSLLAATLHIDLGDRTAAEARLATAEQMATHAGHREIRAWCLETRAWDVLTARDYRGALVLSRQAQAMAPKGTSVHIQATAQEGRARARMRQQGETQDALRRLHRLVSGLPQPEQPEHHYHYDPAKAVSSTATTLAWVHDGAAEEYAREALAQMESPADGPPRPRRAALARLDLGLALLAADKPDEAGSMALDALASGRIVPSNLWRVEEVLTAVETSGVREAAAPSSSPSARLRRERLVGLSKRRRLPHAARLDGGQDLLDAP